MRKLDSAAFTGEQLQIFINELERAQQADH